MVHFYPVTHSPCAAGYAIRRFRIISRESRIYAPDPVAALLAACTGPFPTALVSTSADTFADTFAL
jgi:hypothetical protein